MKKTNKSQNSNNQRRKGLLWLFLALIVTMISASIPAHAGVQLQGWRDLNPSLTPDGMAGNAGTYQYVLFGKYSGNPILWRILSADQTGTERRGFLYSEKALEEKQFDSIMGSNNYGKSAIRTFLVGTGGADFYRASNFTDAEKSVVIEQSFTTTKGDGTDSITTTNNAMFLLSSGDLQEPQYGFLNDSNRSDVNREAVDTGGNAASYWTRSPSDSTIFAYYVYHDGKPNFGMVSLSLVFVRPACFLNIESVLFKAAADDFVSAPSVGEAGSSQNPYVLVLPNAVPTGSPAGWTMQFAAADEAPLSVQIDGKVLTMEWNTPLSPAVKRWPAPGDFKLSTGETPISVISDDANPKWLKLTFATGVTAGTAVTLSYTLNTDAIAFDTSSGTAKIADSFANRPVKNATTSSGGGGGGGTMDTVVRPVATPPGGAFVGPQTVELTSATPGATIYYTLDCSDPETSPTRQKYTEPIIIPMNTMLKAYAVKSGMYDSALLIQCYIQKDTVFMPIASPPGGIFRSEQTVYLSSETSSATLYYTLDGSDPVTNPKGTRQTYTKALRIPLGTTLKAYAEKEGLLPSAVLTETYTPDKETSGGGGGCDAGMGMYSLFLLLSAVVMKKIK